MKDVISESNAEHYVWGENCDGWILLRTPNLSIIKERVPPGGKEKKHYHEQSIQFFHILHGEAVIETDNQVFTLKEGEGIQIEPNTPHQFRNESNKDVVFIVTSSPSTLNDRIELE